MKTLHHEQLQQLVDILQSSNVKKTINNTFSIIEECSTQQTDKGNISKP